MSRIGKVPIIIPEGVEVKIDGLQVKMTGPKGSLDKIFSGDIKFTLENNSLKVSLVSINKHSKAMWGTARSIINNMVIGVQVGFIRELEVNGVGYRASFKGSYLNLSLAKSHNTKIEVPVGLNVQVPKQNQIILESVDKEKLGHFASIIIKQRPPEPYKGKGIRIKGQYVQRKEGKKK